jgi:molybdopterin-guanine dinucleotide biosynthesis protein A
MDRLRQQSHPWLAQIAISANRHHGRYAAWGAPVWPDTNAPLSGPLAGWLSGLTNAPTEWLLSVPCDCPHFPLDLVARLVGALQTSDADIAMAWGPSGFGQPPQLQPVFALMHRRLAPSLRAIGAGGELGVAAWAQQHASAVVRFDQAADDPQAFVNINTWADLSLATGE